QLLQAAATGPICRMLVDEGGLGRVLWAGRLPAGEGSAPTSLRLTAHFANLRYAIEIGQPGKGDAALVGEPIVKTETLTHTGIGAGGSGERVVMQREGASVRLRNAKGERQHLKQHLLPSETALHGIRDVASYPELAYVRELLEGWRIYHRFNLATEAPSRAPALATMTPALATDGRDLAAALATITAGQPMPDALITPLRDAFPGALLETSVADGRASFELRLPDMDRALSAREMSEGTLQYLCLLAVLTAYRKPALIAINEPEASLHESFLAPLARLIARAGASTDTGSQICVVTQSGALAREIAKAADIRPLKVVRESGETRIDGLAAPLPASGTKASAEQPEVDAQIEEVRSLTAARTVLADIRTLIARLREHPDEVAEIHPKIEARLARLRSTAVALPPEFSSLTGRLDEELRAIVANPSEDKRSSQLS
ncbi:MAG TPA: AAA family ATPase, partial [Hyphomicrobiaceae bacterium]|nr:AAA family ATPase [Hyphomicrobiaceae bacterium]